MLFRVILFVILPVFFLVLGGLWLLKTNPTLAVKEAKTILKWLVLAIAAAILAAALIAGIYQIEHLI